MATYSKDMMIKTNRKVRITFAIFSEPDESEDGTTQMIRKKLREYTDRLFALRDEVEKYFDNFKCEFV